LNIRGVLRIDAAGLRNFVGSELSGFALVVIPEVVEEENSELETSACEMYRSCTARRPLKDVVADIVCTGADLHHDVHGIAIALPVSFAVSLVSDSHPLGCGATPTLLALLLPDAGRPDNGSNMKFPCAPILQANALRIAVVSTGG